MQVALNEFLSDQQAKSYRDVIEDSRLDFQLILDFFNREDVQARMESSELHHNRPPLAGVIRELEALPEVNTFFSTYGSQNTRRFRQAVGVLIRLHMEGLGWSKTGRKGSVGLSKYFIRAERYYPPPDHKQIRV